jgi:carbohydrate ABC transporter substrate-binding protein, CUT1 family (TC 3.A.1.1.-)
MKMRKVVSAMLVAAMATGMVAGCGSSSDSKSDKKDAKGKVYYLNFKPEQDEQWQDLAKRVYKRNRSGCNSTYSSIRRIRKDIKI